jgi:surface antigen/LysM repeat protein
MDRIDYTFKFSTELIVVSFSLITIGFSAGNLQAFDNNPLSRLLSYYPSENQALLAKITQTKTIVAQDQNVLQSAGTKIVLAAEQFDPNAGNDNNVILAESDSIISNNSIERPNVDSVQNLITDQIKVYTTVAGDTLQSIAERNGISTNTIKWSNNLTSDTIKPGWNLVIIPTNGILHRVSDNDTLPDIAHKYKADIKKIISYNNLTDENDINPGDLVIVPDGTITPPPTPKIQPKPTVKQKVNGKLVVLPAADEDSGVNPADNDGSNHIFPWGQCTWYAAKKYGGVKFGGNANRWLVNSRAYGHKTGNTPVRGAIVVTNENRRYGHVAYIERIEEGRFLISEMNYKGVGVITERWIDNDSSVIKGFIY